MLSRNVVKELPLHAASQPRRAHFSPASRRKPEITDQGSSGGVKQPKCEANHSPAFGAEACNEWSYNSAFTIRLHGADREKFTLFIGSAVYRVWQNNLYKV